MDRSSSRPLHAQVSEALREEIRDRRLPAGFALPSEESLRQRFGVARSVMRQALATLVAEGLVDKGRGRGSVVAPASEHHRLVQRSSGLFSQMAAEGLTVTTRVLQLREEGAPAVAQWLGTPRVLRLERLRSVEGNPLAYIRTYLPLPRCSGLSSDELTDASLHDVLISRLGLRPTNGRRQVRAVAADTDLAASLEVAPGSPLLLLEGHGNDHLGRPLEVFATWHSASDIAFDIDVQDDTGTAALSGPVARASPGELSNDSSRGHDSAPEDLRAAAESAQRLAALLSSLADE